MEPPGLPPGTMLMVLTMAGEERPWELFVPIDRWNWTAAWLDLHIRDGMESGDYFRLVLN